MPLAIYIFSLCAFSLGFTEFVSIGLVSAISADLNISVATVGTAVTAYALGAVLGAPFLTALASRWSRKYLLLTTMLVFSLANLAIGFSSDFMVVLLARFISGLAHGVFFAVASSIAVQLAGIQRAGTALALVFGGLTIAMAFGVPLGAYLGSIFAWQPIFIAIALFGSVGVAGLLFFMPKGLRAGGSVRKGLRAILNPRLLAAAAIPMLAYSGSFALYTYISPLLLGATGVSLQSASLMMLVYGCSAAVGNIAGGKMNDRLGIDRACLLIVAGITLVLLMMGLAIHSRLMMAILIGLLGALTYAAVPALQARLIGLAERHEPQSVAVISGLNIAGFNSGIALGSLIGGSTIIVTNIVFLPFVGALVCGMAVIFLTKQIRANSA